MNLAFNPFQFFFNLAFVNRLVTLCWFKLNKSSKYAVISKETIFKCFDSGASVKENFFFFFFSSIINWKHIEFNNYSFGYSKSYFNFQCRVYFLHDIHSFFFFCMIAIIIIGFLSISFFSAFAWMCKKKRLPSTTSCHSKSSHERNREIKWKRYKCLKIAFEA